MASLKKNLLYQTAHKLLISAAPLLTTPYLSRVLGASKLGVFSYEQSVVNFFLLFAMLGISNYGVRTIAAERKKDGDVSRVFWNIYAIQFTSSSLMALLYVGYILLFVTDNAAVAWAFLSYLIGDMLDVSWFFYGMEEINITAMRGMAIKILSVFSVFLFVHSPEDIWVYAFIVAGGTALGQIAIWPAFLKRVRYEKPAFSEIRKHIKPILLLFVPLAAISVYHIMDKIMLGLISDELNSGYYYNADKVVNIPIVLITGIHAVFLPRCSNLLATDEGGEKTRAFQSEAMMMTNAMAAALACGIAAVSDEFVPVFFGAGYEACVLLIKVFACVMIAKSFSSAMRSLYIIPAKKDKIYIVSVFFGALINLIANFILMYVFRLGALGATIGTLLAEGSVALLDVILVNKKLPGMKVLRAVASGAIFFVAGIAMFFVVRVFRRFILAGAHVFPALIIECAFGALFYVSFAAVYAKITRKNVLKMILSNRK